MIWLNLPAPYMLTLSYISGNILPRNRTHVLIYVKVRATYSHGRPKKKG